VRGDANADGAVRIEDAIAVLGYLFSGGGLPCLNAADLEGNGAINVGDAIRILGYLFVSGPPPAPPFPDCGRAPAAGGLTCESFPACAR
jgi:hypothetical protein